MGIHLKNVKKLFIQILCQCSQVLTHFQKMNKIILIDQKEVQIRAVIFPFVMMKFMMNDVLNMFTDFDYLIVKLHIVNEMIVFHMCQIFFSVLTRRSFVAQNGRG